MTEIIAFCQNVEVEVKVKHTKMQAPKPTKLSPAVSETLKYLWPPV